MINISKVFRLQQNLIFAINEQHEIKQNDTIVDNNGRKYEVIGICYQTNDLLVKPLSKVDNLDSIKTIC